MLKFLSIFSWLGVTLSVLVIAPLTMLVRFVDGTGAMGHSLVRVWARMVLFSVRVDLHVSGAENIEANKSYVIASNHEGQADIPVLVTALPLQFKFASKVAVFRIPVLGWAMHAARYVPIDRGAGPDKAREALARMSEKIKEGFSVLMFPEGTRTRDGKVGPFKSGTFRLAMQNKVDILPVGIYGSRLGMPAEDWVIRGGHIIVKIGQPIRVTEFEDSEDGMRKFRDKCRERVIELHRDVQQLYYNDKLLTAAPVAKALG